MSYIVFARKWRPQDFDEIVGQAHITATLKNAIKLNRVGQAYLFTGPRGVGKTSTARIFAKALNCKEGPRPSPCNKCVNCSEITAANSLDVIEIDGASNRGIDEIRTLRENVKLSPLSGRFKIYIIDEVHQITPPAFNALLKTLEEPPPHVKFIFATTQPNKIPATILSRCQRFDFRRVSTADLISKLKEIAKAEKIDAQESVFFEVAKASDGSMRDAESILDQLNSFCDKRIEPADITKVLGIIEDELLIGIAELIRKRDIASLLKAVNDLTNDGKDLFQFLARFIEHIRNLSILKINKNLAAVLALSDETLNKLNLQVDNFTLEDLIYIFYLLYSTYEGAKKTGLIRFSLEFAFIKIVKREDFVPINELLNKIKKSVGAQFIEPVGDGRDPSASLRTGKSRPYQTAQTPDASAQSADIDINAKWPEVINILSKKKVSIASFLIEGEPAGIEKGVLKVNFPKMHKFHKEILEEPANKKIIEDILEEVLEAPIKLEFDLAEGIQPKNNIKFNDDKDEKKQEDDPILKDALDVFNGSVIKNGQNNRHA